MTVGCLLGGALSDFLVSRFGGRVGRCFLAAFCFLLVAILLLLGSRAISTTAASFILAAGAGTLYIAASCFWAVAADIGAKDTAVVSSIMNMGAQAGGACTAVLTPLLAAHFGWNVSFLTASGVSLAGAFSWLLIRPQLAKGWSA
jgi:ACS family glucarate transporter-like MFS transporter